MCVGTTPECPLRSTWGTSLGEDKFGAGARILNTKVARRARAGQTLPQGVDPTGGDPRRDPTPKGGGGGYSPPNCRTPLGVTHWLAAAPVVDPVLHNGRAPFSSTPRRGCMRREGTSEVAPEAVRQAVGGGCRSGWGFHKAVLQHLNCWHSSPWPPVPASMAFVTDSNRPKPLWQRPRTACPTASGAAWRGNGAGRG